MIKCISIRDGYAESARLGRVILTYSGEGFKSPKEAVCNLADSIYDLLTDFTVPKFLKPCCQEMLGKFVNFCSKCGTHLLRKDFDPDSYVDMVRMILSGISDGVDEIKDPSCVSNEEQWIWW